jgi:predicted lipoprotein
MRIGWLAMGVALTIACALPARAETASRIAIIERAANDYFIPAYKELLTDTSLLTSSMGKHCNGGGAETAEAVSAAFAKTVSTWAKIDFARFGPMARDARLERFSFWPDVRGTGARQLRQLLTEKDPSVFEPGALQRRSAALEGLPALESLLYSGDSALLSGAPLDDFRCQLALAITRNVNAIAALASVGWGGQSSFLKVMTSPGPENIYYPTSAEVETELLRAILTAIEQDRDLKLLPAFGNSAAEAKASRAPFFRSGLTIAFLKDSVAAIAALVETSGILSLLPESQTGLRDKYATLMAEAQSGLDDAGPDFSAAIVDSEGRQSLTKTMTALAELRELFRMEIAPATGITPGFNSLDGD